MSSAAVLCGRLRRRWIGAKRLSDKLLMTIATSFKLAMSDSGSRRTTMRSACNPAATLPVCAAMPEASGRTQRGRLECGGGGNAAARHFGDLIRQCEPADRVVAQIAARRHLDAGRDGVRRNGSCARQHIRRASGRAPPRRIRLPVRPCRPRTRESARGTPIAVSSASASRP